MKTNFSNQLRQDLLITALEGGSNYWLELSTEDIQDVKDKTEDGKAFSERVWDYVKAGNTLKVYDAECPEDLLGELSLENIKFGEEIMLEKYSWHYENATEDSWDSETADVWFQLCTMNDIVFG